MLHPTIVASLAPFFPAIWPNYSGNAVADAESHHDMLADTFTTDVTYIGLVMTVEVNRHSRNCVDIVAEDGSDLFYELSDHARNKIAHLAIKKAGQWL